MTCPIHWLSLKLPHRDYQLRSLNPFEDFGILKNSVSYLLCFHTTSFLATPCSSYLHVIGSKPYTEVERLAETSFVQFKDGSLRGFLSVHIKLIYVTFSPFRLTYPARRK